MNFYSVKDNNRFDYPPCSFAVKFRINNKSSTLLFQRYRTLFFVWTNTAKIFHKLLRSSIHNHRNPSTSKLVVHVISGDARRRQNQMWRRDLLADWFPLPHILKCQHRLSPPPETTIWIFVIFINIVLKHTILVLIVKQVFTYCTVLKKKQFISLKCY